MITFSDLCTLLLTCFVLFLSMSSMNSKALKTTFRNFDSTVSSLARHDAPQAALTPEAAVQEVLQGLQKAGAASVRDLDNLPESELGDPSSEKGSFSGTAIWIKRDKNSNGFSVVFGDSILFDSGGADLHEEALPVLEALGNFIRSTEYHAYVDGHTDALSVRNEKFATNDNLALARSLAVLQFFLNNCQVAPDRLAAGAYGSSHPLLDNRTTVNRAINRRVEIIFEPPV